MCINIISPLRGVRGGTRSSSPSSSSVRGRGHQVVETWTAHVSAQGIEDRGHRPQWPETYYRKTSTTEYKIYNIKKMGMFKSAHHPAKTDPFFMLYIIYCSVEVSLLHDSGHREKCLRHRCPGQTRAMFKLRQPVDLFTTLKTVKGLLYLVPSRTPRSSGYGVLCTCALCYMLFLLYV